MALGNIKKTFLTLIFFALVILTAAGRDAGTGNNGAAGQADRATTMNPQKMGTADAQQWFADPKHGWIRVEKRSDAQDNKSGSSHKNRSENSGAKASGILGEY